MINIFDAESATGLMCQFIFEDMIESRRIFAAISQVSFERGHPIRQQIAACQRPRAEKEFTAIPRAEWEGKIALTSLAIRGIRYRWNPTDHGTYIYQLDQAGLSDALS